MSVDSKQFPALRLREVEHGHGGKSQVERLDASFLMQFAHGGLARGLLFNSSSAPKRKLTKELPVRSRIGRVATTVSNRNVENTCQAVRPDGPASPRRGGGRLSRRADQPRNGRMKS